MRAAREAGALLAERFGGPAKGLGTKTTPTDLVSDADRDAEAAVEGIIRSSRPHDALTGEEGLVATGSTGISWLVDPLDGTVNYLYGIPHWCVSVGASDQSGPLVGVIFDPSKDELFQVTRGGGAFVNGRPLAVTSCASLAEALIATGFAYDAERRALQAETTMPVASRARDLRRFGSAALDLAYVAAARYDAYFETGVQPWDIAAGALLVAEAGGRVTVVSAIGRDERTGIIASCAGVHAELLALLEVRPT